VALSHIDPERSRIEVPSLIANVQPDAFVAHATFWQREKHEDMLGTYAIAYRTSYLSDSTSRSTNWYLWRGLRRHGQPTSPR
jgi:hypothetical protein